MDLVVGGGANANVFVDSVGINCSAKAATVNLLTCYKRGPQEGQGEACLCQGPLEYSLCTQHAGSEDD